MHVHSARVGEKGACNFTSAHHKKRNELSTSTHTHTHTHKHSRDKWEGELQAIMKDVS